MCHVSYLIVYNETGADDEKIKYQKNRQPLSFKDHMGNYDLALYSCLFSYEVGHYFTNRTGDGR